MKLGMVIVVAWVGGCTLYDNPCDTDNDVYALSTRDPQTGACIAHPQVCNQPTNEGSSGAPAVAACDVFCAQYDAATCLVTNGCHPAYTESGSGFYAFASCWDIWPLDPLKGGICTDLDAVTCAQSEDCASVMVAEGSGFTFGSCTFSRGD